MHRLSGVERNAKMFAWLLAAAALIGSIVFALADLRYAAGEGGTRSDQDPLRSAGR